MPVLSNQKHERFAQAVAKGLSASAAYVEAGYPKNDGNASRLKGSDKVKARIEELQTVAAEKAGITIEWIVDGLYKIADSLEEKASDRISAFEKLGKHLGMFKDKVEHSGSVNVFSFKLDKANANDPV